MINQELPKSWVVNRLGDFVLYQKGKKPKSLTKIQSKSHHIAYVNIKAFEQGLIDEYTDGEGCVLCEDNDFLMVWDGSRSGYVGRAIKGALGSTLVRIYFPGVNLDYAYFFLQSKFLEINSRAKGTGIPHVDPDLVWNYSFPLPPLAEQHRIVAKIEELFSELDNGVETLKKAKQQLKIYRQAVLKYAFEGKLTNPDVKEGELPEGWEEKIIGQLAVVVRGGSPRPAGDKRFYEGNIPFLKVKDLTKDDHMFVNSAEHSIKEAGLHKTRLVGAGTLLLSNSGATLGVPKITSFETTMNDGVAAFLNLKCEPEYLYYFWKSKTVELRMINQGAAQPNLNIELITNQSIHIPSSVSVQKYVVQEIESRLSVCDKIEESIEHGLQQAEALRQSILKRAFEGKLVPQDPSDEPASVLLERIKAERVRVHPQRNTKSKKIK